MNGKVFLAALVLSLFGFSAHLLIACLELFLLFPLLNFLLLFNHVYPLGIRQLRLQRPHVLQILLRELGAHLHQLLLVECQVVLSTYLLLTLLLFEFIQHLLELFDCFGVTRSESLTSWMSWLTTFLLYHWLRYILNFVVSLWWLLLSPHLTCGIWLIRWRNSGSIICWQPLLLFFCCYGIWWSYRVVHCLLLCQASWMLQWFDLEVACEIVAKPQLLPFLLLFSLLLFLVFNLFFCFLLKCAVSRILLLEELFFSRFP